MSTTLCGHERAVLVASLEYIAVHDDGVALLHARMKPDLLRQYGHSPETMVDLHDPAKLAKLMAEELRRRGVELPEAHDQAPTSDQIEIRLGGSDEWHVLSMSQARAALLHIMRLPEGTSAQDALKALEVGT